MEEQNSPAWQPPPPPEKIEAPEAAEVSEAATLGSIFFEPGRTFEDLRRKPRFIIAGLIILVVLSIFNFAFIQRLGYERIVRDRMDANPRVQQMPADQKAHHEPPGQARYPRSEIGFCISDLPR